MRAPCTYLGAYGYCAGTKTFSEATLLHFMDLSFGSHLSKANLHFKIFIYSILFDYMIYIIIILIIPPDIIDFILQFKF